MFYITINNHGSSPMTLIAHENFIDNVFFFLFVITRKYKLYEEYMNRFKCKARPFF